jgi:hypothetical protein
MRVTVRIHEWLAERLPWVQYPDARFGNEPRFRLADLSRKQRWWVVFALFWGSLICLSIYGNLIN